MTKKVYIRSYGCQMNEYDTARTADLLQAERGYERTDDPEQADLVLFNTCSIREKAAHKVFSDLGRVKALKARGALIGVGGCVASQEGDAIVERAPFVDLVFGPQTLHRLPQMIDLRLADGRPQVDVSFPEIEKFDHLPPARVAGPTAFVSIMEGCSKYCSYCVVPYTRGEEVSRPLDDVLAEIGDLAARGVREVTLLGQNVNAWRDSGSGGPADFALLLECVAALPGIERIRYTTSHPKEFTPRLIDAYARLPKLAAHLHLPVQHGSDRILGPMKRGYTIAQYKAIVQRLYAVCPQLSLSTDFIVGFPGETDADHALTLQLVDELGFDASFSFVYSPRPGTPAANLRDATPHEVKLQRLQQLQARLDANARRIAQARVGTVQRVLVEGPARRPGPQGAELMGRTSCNRIVNFSGPDELIGRMVELTITEALPHSLRGRWPAAAALQPLDAAAPA